MHQTNYVKATSTEDAVGHVATGGQLLAGGMTLLPTMKQRLASPESLVDLADCGLAGIEDTGDAIKIGAMTRHVDVANSPVVQSAIPGLAALAGGIGDRQVRNRGTIGGSVANNDPSACYPSAVLGLGATVHTNKRDIGADDFFTGMFETALDEGEMITAISFPAGQGRLCEVPQPGVALRHGWCVRRQRRPGARGWLSPEPGAMVFSAMRPWNRHWMAVLLQMRWMVLALMPMT